MGKLNFLNTGERTLLRMALSSIRSRYASRLRRLLRRNPSGRSNSAHSSCRIILSTPSITTREIGHLLEAALRGWDREPVRQFEKAMANHLGADHALATSSCTGALHLALKACGIGPGDEVIMPESTCIATASAVLLSGASPVFADVDPVTWCLDPMSVRRSITGRTRAIIPVHLYGRIGEIDALMTLAREFGLYVIEDAAAAIGARLNGKPAGTLGHAAALSFHSTKLLTTAEGGMLVTSDAKLFERAHCLAYHGVKDDLQLIPREVGVNYKMSHLNAAIGLGQLERLGELLDRKRQIFDWYEPRLKQIPGILLDAEFARSRSNLWMVVAMLDDERMDRRDIVIEKMRQEGVFAAPFTATLSSLPAFQSCRDANPCAHDLARRGILLPSGFDVRESHVQQICSLLRRSLDQSNRPI